MVVVQEPKKGLENFLNAKIEKIEIKSVRKLLSKVFPLFKETIKQDGISSIPKIAKDFESKYGISGLAKILAKKGLEYFKHKAGMEPEYGNLTRFYDMKRVEAVFFLSKLSQNNPYKSYGSARYPDGTRIVDDYENYQSVFWAHGWR